MKSLNNIILALYVLALLFGTAYVTNELGYSNWLWVLTILLLCNGGYESKK